MISRLFYLCLVAGGLLLSSAASAAAADPQVPTAADFGAPPFLESPQISPDGKYVAASGLVDGVRKLLMIDISQPSLKLDQVPIPAENEIEWIRWAGSGRLLVSLSKADSLMGEEVRVRRLIGIDLEKGTTNVLGPKTQGVIGDDVVYVAPDGEFILLNTQATIYDYPSVYRVDLATGRFRQLVAARENVWDWYADRLGVVRAGVGTSNGKTWMLYRRGEDDSFERKRDVLGDESGVQSLAPLPGSDAGYALALGKNRRFGLFHYDFANDKVGEAVFESGSVDVDDFSLGRDGALLSVSYVDDQPEIVWFDAELKKVQGGLNKAIPGAINRIVSVNEDHTRFIVLSSSATNPGTYYIYDRKSRNMRLLADPYNRIAGKQLAEMKPVRYKARDGIEIRGYLTLPPGRDPRKLPLIVMPHGGPFVRDVLGYSDWVQYLASRGYAVLQPNYRGSTGFGLDFVKLGHGQWGRGMQDDLDDGVAWLTGEGTADAGRVCIMGGSYGGYAAEWAAIRNPNRYRCAISFAGVSDLAAQLRYSRQSFAAPRYFRDWRNIVKGEKTFDLDGISPLKQAGRVAIPLLIAHGTKDDIVPVSQSRRLHDALTKAGRDHEYVLYEGEGHGFAKPVNATDFLDRVGKFLAKHNPS